MKKYTLSQLENIFEELSKTYNNFKRYHLDKIIYTINCADGVKIDIVTPISAVPHLLGVDAMYYKTVFAAKENSADKIFEEMLDRGAYNVYSNMEKINIDRLISPYVLNKLENFVNVTWMSSSDIEFICNYNRQKSYGVTNDAEDYDHLVVSKLDNGKYSYLTFSDNVYGGKTRTVPRSNQLLDSAEELYEKCKGLEKQSITIPTITSSYDTYNYEEKFKWFLPEDEKKEKALKALRYANDFNANLDIVHDYISSLNFSNKKTKKRRESNETLDLITSAIRVGKIIDEKDLKVQSFDYIPDEFVALIEAYNDTIAGAENDSGIEKVNYSDMRNQIQELKQKIVMLNTKIEELTDVNTAVTKRYLDSESELAEYDKKIEAIKKIINS